MSGSPTAEQQLEQIDVMLANVAGIDRTLPTLERLRRLISEFERLDERQPHHAALRALDRLTRHCADGEVLITRASGPSIREDAAILAIERERGRSALRVVVHGNGWVLAELVSGDDGQVFNLGPAPEGASATLLWLGMLFAGEIEPLLFNRPR